MPDRKANIPERPCERAVQAETERFFLADKCFGVLGAKPLGERVAKDGAFARGKPPPLAHLLLYFPAKNYLQGYNHETYT